MKSKRPKIQTKLFVPKSTNVETITSQCVVCGSKRTHRYNGKGKRPDESVVCERCQEINAMKRYALFELHRPTSGYTVTSQKILQHHRAAEKL